MFTTPIGCLSPSLRPPCMLTRYVLTRYMLSTQWVRNDGRLSCEVLEAVCFFCLLYCFIAHAKSA